jgi:hypothetical protein
MPYLSYKEKNQLYRREANRLCIACVRKYPKLGAFPAQYSSKVDWLLDQPEIRRYLSTGPKIRVPGYESSNPNGSVLTVPREIVEYLLEDAYALFYKQQEQLKTLWWRMITSKVFIKLSVNQKHELWLLYEQSLEQGPQVLFPNSFIVERLAINDGINISRPRAGQILSRLVELGFVVIIEHGHASRLPQYWKSRQVSLNEDWVG